MRIKPQMLRISKRRIPVVKLTQKMDLQQIRSALESAFSIGACLR